jgi:aromatic-L-amino-acid decarboxylase
MELHDSGEAAPSLTVLDGVAVIRAAIVNHRTTDADIDHFMRLLERTGLRVRNRLARPVVRTKA